MLLYFSPLQAEGPAFIGRAASSALRWVAAQAWRYAHMARYWLASWPKRLACSCAFFLAAAGVSRAGDNDSELRALIEAQGKQIEALKQQLQTMPTVKPAAEGADGAGPKLDDEAVKKIVADFLKDNPGAGMPPSVQTGYSTATGFTIKSANNPPYVKWDDE